MLLASSQTVIFLVTLSSATQFHHDLSFTALPNKAAAQLSLVRDWPTLEGYDSTVHVCSTPMTSTIPADDTEARGHITLQYARPTSISTTLKYKAIDPNVRYLPKLSDLLPDQVALIDQHTKQLKDEFPTVFKRASKMTVKNQGQAHYPYTPTTILISSTSSNERIHQPRR